jgi:phosphoribosylformylglycinamidine synthase, purS protein
MPKVTVYVTLKPTLLDAQGRTVETALHQLGFEDVSSVRIGKIIEMQAPEGEDPQVLRERVAAMCEKLLANPVTEDYRIVIGPEADAQEGGRS